MIDKNITEYKMVRDKVENVVETRVVERGGRYHTVTETINNFISVEDQVNDLIKEGWQPYGNALSDPDKEIYQPMVKYGQPPVQRPSNEVLTGRK